jgi:hypothetical protein
VSRILFVMLHPGFIRYYDSALQALAAAGHDVHVAFEISREKLGEDVTARRLAAATPRLTVGATPERGESVRDFLVRGDRTATRSGGAGVSAWSREGRDEAWDSLGTTVRLLLDYLRFFDPVFARATALRARAEKRVPRVYRGAVRLVSTAGTAPRRALAALLRGVERVIPVNRAIETFLREHNPDLLLVTPLIELGSQQVDYVKCARQLGIRSALCVASWDNLTSKGLVRVVPDHVVVWNEAQKREAVELHGVAPDQVVVTGAQLFDRWFAARPERSRRAFCEAVGLDPDRPYILYVGSSIFIAPEEVPFVERWLAALQAAGSPVTSYGVLIRPHPANARQWRAFEASEFEHAAVWPPIGTDPNAPDFHRDYFESLYYSAAVVGINTSAQLEAAIVGRPVFTVRAPEFAHAQEGTLHFQHVAGSDGSLVHVANTLDEHVRQLSAAAGRDAGHRDFVESFLRPHGLDVAATGVFQRAIETLTQLPRLRPQPPPWWVSVTRPPAFVLARLARLLADDRPLWVYPLQPLLAGSIRTWGAVCAAHDASDEAVRRANKRFRRRVRRAWHETSRDLEKRLRRTKKTITARIRGAGAAAKRVARRSV